MAAYSISQNFPKFTKMWGWQVARVLRFADVRFRDGAGVVEGVRRIPLSGQKIVSHSGPNRTRGGAGFLPVFFAGPENPLVEVAVLNVLDAAGNGCNPLVFYGAKGTGKSHLARGLAAAWQDCRPGRALYTTAADFAGELADAVELQAVAEFRQKYHEPALLVVEDLGALLEKNSPDLAPQQELIHTLDALLARGSRVVVTASNPAEQLAGLLPALQSRLSAGLVVGLLPPAVATRRAVLDCLAALRKIDLTVVAAELLAERLNTTVPGLVAALKELQLTNGQGDRTYIINTGMVHKYLAQRNGGRRPELREIAAAVARRFELRLSDLRSASRRHALVTARNTAFYLARRLTGASFEQIGRYFAGRDHTTVMHGCRKLETLITTDPGVRRLVNTLRQKWEGS